MKKYLVIVPAFNEEKNVEAVIDEIRATGIAADILVVDDGSRDKTAELAREKNCEVVTLHFNTGYGTACQTGFKFALERNYPFVLQMDSDGQHKAESLKAIMEKLEEDAGDIVIGSRFLGPGKYKMGIIRKLSIGMFRQIIRLRTGVKITDPSSGLQGMNRRAYAYYSIMDNYPEDYPDADVIMKMLLKGYRIMEVPAEFRERASGKSMHSGFKPVFYMFKMLVSILLVILTEKGGRRR